jgi:hypothetical protein
MTPKKLGNLIENQGAKRVSHALLPAGAGCEDEQVIELSKAPT